MANGHGGRREGAGGKPKDPAAIARALDLIASGECANAQEAAEHPEIRGRIGWRQIHEARRRAEQEVAAKPAPKVTAAVRPTSAATAAATLAPPDEEPEAPALVVERPPKGLSPRMLRIWYIERRIEAITTALARAEAMGERGLLRMGTLSDQLRKWLDELAKLAPPEPVSKDDEEARWRAAAASAVAKIERGVREIEGSAACRKCGAACATCASA